MEDRLHLLREFARAQRHSHFDVRGLPPLVDAPIGPRAAILEPSLTRDLTARTTQEFMADGGD